MKTGVDYNTGEFCEKCGLQIYKSTKTKRWTHATQEGARKRHKATKRKR